MIPVVVCVWRRPHRLEELIASLAAQSHPVSLNIWNNNSALRSVFDRTVARASDLDIDVIHSSRNAGGFGRFYLARRLAARHDRVVFMDDDQLPGPDFVAALNSQFESNSMRGTWGYRFRTNQRYADRVAALDGQRIKYCGTGGMISDARVFLQPGLFKCPRRFWFVEDLWLSYYADHVLGWPLYKVAAEIATDSDEHDQCNILGSTKDRFFRHLVRLGWNPLQIPD